MKAEFDQAMMGMQLRIADLEYERGEQEEKLVEMEEKVASLKFEPQDLDGKLNGLVLFCHYQDESNKNQA